jgi:hypothetical protein
MPANHRANRLALETYTLTEATLAAFDTDRFAWIDVRFSPPESEIWVEADYIPGPASRQTLGDDGEIESLPMWVLRLCGPANTGGQELEDLADALLVHFAAGTSITNNLNDVIRVRGDVAPFRGQLLRTATMAAVITVTVPLRLRTAN